MLWAFIAGMYVNNELSIGQFMKRAAVNCQSARYQASWLWLRTGILACCKLRFLKPIYLRWSVYVDEVTMLDSLNNWVPLGEYEARAHASPAAGIHILANVGAVNQNENKHWLIVALDSLRYTLAASYFIPWMHGQMFVNTWASHPYVFFWSSNFHI